MNGIDVSEHNCDIDWKSVKESGKVNFCIVNAGVRMPPLSSVHFCTIMEQ